MRFLVLIPSLLCLAASPALAQNGQDNGNGQGNAYGQDNGNGNGNGNSNGQGNSNTHNNGNGNSASTGPTKGSQTEGTVHYTQDDARDAVSAGKAVSLASLLPDLQERAGGEVIDAELLNVQGILVYSMKVLRPDGHVTQEYYYAQSGRFIGSEP